MVYYPTFYVMGRTTKDAQGRIIVYQGEVIGAQVTWQNTGATSYAPKMRLDLRRTATIPYPMPSWQEGEWAQCAAVAAGGQGTCVVTSIPIPSGTIGPGTQWEPGVTIDVKIQVLGIEGPSWQEDDIFVVGEEVPVAIISVTPYVVEG
jgi:hypothetical protein